MDEKFEANNKILTSLMDVKLDNFGKKIEENLEVKMLEWKSGIVDSVDGLAKEMGDEKDFRDIGDRRIGSSTRRIEGLEKKVFGSVQSEI